MLKRWNITGGYREVLKIGLPLVISMASTTVMQFTDRIFLGNYSVEAIAASLPAGITSFLFISFFMGVASYTNVFIAQYIGSGAHHRVGAALWQGIWFSVFAGAVLASLYFAAEPLFSLGGHPPNIAWLEIAYFRILTLGAGFAVMAVALSCFFSGRGITRPVMVVNFLGAALNIPLDYCLIYGVGPFPEMGIVGAGLATVTAQVFTTMLFTALVFSKRHNRRFAVLTRIGLERDLFGRLMRYGLPGGVQFFLEIFAITFFVFMIGRLGTVELAATNIVFAIDSLAFLPMIGFSVAVSTMVGQAIGRGLPRQAEQATTSTIHITLAYMAVVLVMFLAMPRELISWFQGSGEEPAMNAQVMDMSVILLRLVALYCLFDGLGIIYAGALKGAGDTRYVMLVIAFNSMLVMVLPVFLLVEVFHAGVYMVWPVITVYIIVLGGLLWWRYRGGKWKGMRVIERVGPPGARG